MFPLLHPIEPLEPRIAPAGVASINVTSLDGSNGLRVNGTGAEHYAGTSVDVIGDVNGDNLDDFILSEIVPPEQNREGRAFVVFGKAGGFPASLDPLTLNGTNGFRISGLIASLQFLTPAVRWAGDVNNDTFDDVLVTGGGTAHVIFGKASGFAAEISVTSLSGANGFSFGNMASAFDDEAAGAGDVNADGYDDLIYSVSNEVYVLFGKASGFAAFTDVTTLNGSDGFHFDVPDDERAPRLRGIGAIGDVNGDGIDDVAVGSQLFSNVNRDAYVLFGHAAPFAAALSSSALNGANGFRIQGDTQNLAGLRVSAGGDINGDGLADLLTSNVVVFGRSTAFPASLAVDTLNGTYGFRIQPSGSPDRSVAGAGDYNADGFDDVLVGNFGGDSAFLLFGKATPFSSDVDVSAVDGSNGLTIVLPAAGTDPTPRGTLGGAGDVNGDGLDDIIVGARSADTNGANSGAAYVIFALATSLSVSDATVAEGLNGTGAATFTVSLSGALDRAVSVFVSTADGTAVNNEDYDALAPTELNFAPGERTKTVDVLVRGDSKFEPNETFTLNLTNATGATISDAQGIGAITNDDARPSLRINDLSLPEPAEGSTLAALAVNLSNPSSETISVTVSTADGTAFAPGDYRALASTVLTFAPGELAKVVNVPVQADAIFEADENFTVVLSAPTTATIGKATGQVTIQNVQPPPTISVADVEVVEGDAFNVPTDFTVTLSGPSSSPVTMTYMLQAGSAQAPADYVDLEPTLLTFAPGETTKSVRVETVGNTRDDEDTRTFFFHLAEPRGATFADPTGNGVIVDNDALPSFAIGNVAVPEGNTAETFATFTVSLSAASGRATSVDYATASGTATAGTDFTGVSGVLAFAAGETSKTLTVPITGDTINEPDETFLVNLSAPVNATLAVAQGTGTILDNDPQPTISVAHTRVAEGPTGGAVNAVFTVSLSAPSGRDVSVEFVTFDGTARSSSDYTMVHPGTVLIPAGALTGTALVPVTGDRELEATEQFSIELSRPSGATIADGTAIGTIVNDDVNLVSPHLATFTDEDGDLVSVRLTGGKLTVDDFTLALGSGTIGVRLAELNLMDRDGASLVVKATPQPGLGGNGEVNVGRIDATDTPLARVKVRGDLAEIDAGWNGRTVQQFAGHILTARAPIDGAVTEIELEIPGPPVAVGVLDVRSMGGQRQSGAPALESTFIGGVTTLVVGGDLAGVRLVATTQSSIIGFGSINIAGDVDGDGAGGAGVFSNSRIGRVFVGGAWRASDMAAGASAGADALFGTSDDTLPFPSATVAAIARITVKGGVFGTEAAGDHFGFVAEKLGKLKIAGSALPLTPRPRNDLEGIALGTGGDFRAREVASAS